MHLPEYGLTYSDASLVSDDKESACNAGDLGSIPGRGRSPGEGNVYPLQWGFPGGSAVTNLPAIPE